jgi:hypothetical protein
MEEKKSVPNYPSHLMAWGLAILAAIVAWKPSIFAYVYDYAKFLANDFQWWTPFAWIIFSAMLIFTVLVIGAIPAILSAILEEVIENSPKRKQIAILVTGFLAWSIFSYILLGGI